MRFPAWQIVLSNGVLYVCMYSVESICAHGLTAGTLTSGRSGCFSFFFYYYYLLLHIFNS